MARRTFHSIFRDRLKDFARAVGYDVRRALPTPLETVAALLGRDSIHTCFDIGAFRGDYAREMAAAFPSAVVYAYEPNPIEFERLEAAVRTHNRITAIPRGMGAELSTAELHVTTGTASSSLLPLDRDAAAEWGQALTESNRRLIEVVTVDSERCRLGAQTIDFLKVDAQGFEAQILTGADTSLQQRRVRALQIELLVERSYVGQALPHELLARCHGHSLKLRGIYDTYFRDSRLMQFDAVFTLE